MSQLIILSFWAFIIIIIMERLNLTVHATRPDPQGSFYYGNTKIVRTIVLVNSEANINGTLRYAMNGIPYQ